MPTAIDWLKFSYLVQKALSSGAEITRHKCVWDASLGCSKPYEVTLISQPPDSELLPKQRVRDGEICWLDLFVPCRKCPRCLDNRRRFWSSLMKNEISYSHRTWLGTFTINPHWRFIFSCRSGSTDYFKSYSEISKELTKYFKRLRKAGFKFRYVLVAEAHKDGYPHVHILLHETSYNIIPKSRLKAEWEFGFTDFKLVENSDSSYYVAKYLAKDARTRIRASQRYGRSGHDLILSEFGIPLGHSNSLELRDTMTHHLNSLIGDCTNEKAF